MGAGALVFVLVIRVEGQVAPCGDLLGRAGRARSTWQAPVKDLGL